VRGNNPYEYSDPSGFCDQNSAAEDNAKTKIGADGSVADSGFMELACVDQRKSPPQPTWALDLPFIYGPAMNTHHWQPQQFKAAFDRVNLNIEDYTSRIPELLHFRKGGLHPKGYNARAKFLFEGEEKSREDILEQLRKEVETFNKALEKNPGAAVEMEQTEELFTGE
jgi:hypothetical protein